MAKFTRVRRKFGDCYKWIGKKFKSLKNVFVEHPGPITALILIATLLVMIATVLVMIATFRWTVKWSLEQEEKDVARLLEQDKKADARSLEQDKKADARTSAYEKQIERLIQIQNANIKKLTDEYTKIVSEKISDLETNQKANTKELTDEYTKIVSKKISDLNAKMTGETVRMIIASHENIQRARDDTYKKAIDEAWKAGYIYETNQEPGEAGVCIFKTGENWKSGQEDEELSSFLLTIEEKNDIRDCLKFYFEKEKTEKLKDGFANTDTQKKIFSFLLRESNIGSLIISPVCEIPYWTPYREEKTKLLTPFAKLGAVIGHIGDTMKN